MSDRKIRGWYDQEEGEDPTVLLSKKTVVIEYGLSRECQNWVY